MILSLMCALTIGGGVWLLLSRSWLNIILGLGLLGHGANFLILTMGGLVPGKSAFIGAGQSKINEIVADPVPQALILTAIVIGFGMQAFLLVLFSFASKSRGASTDDLSE